MRLKIPACSSGTEFESVLKYLYTAIFMMSGSKGLSPEQSADIKVGAFDPDIIFIGMETLIYGKY